MTSLVAAHDVAVGHGGCSVLTGVSFELAAGEIVAVLGPNGAGKSTLLKSLAGLLPLLEGEVTLDGVSLKALSPNNIAQKIGLVPQEESIEFRFSAREIVAMGRIARSNGLFESVEDHAAVDRALELADVERLGSRPFVALSGGERQRVLIARALAQESPALFLDEPTAHLDVKHQVEVADLLRRLAVDEGRGILIAVHDLNFALAVADRALLLADRRVVAVMPTAELVESHRLDAAYEVSFRRVTIDGRVSLLPPL